MRRLFRSLRLGCAAVGAALMCTAASAVPLNTSTLRVSYSGSGLVVSSDGRISCGPRCSASYARGSLVTLTASAGVEFAFEEWTGACVGKARHCIIALDRDAAVRAAFRRLPPPPPPPPAAQCSDGIDNDGDGLIDYPSDPGCTGALDNDETESPPGPSPPAPPPPPPAPPPIERRIGVTVSVSGQGFIVGAAIRCGGAAGTLLDCEGLFPWGARIVLRAFPSRRGGFVRWGGFCRGEERSCILRTTAPKTVLAVFRR
jgi:List-Bact-rpt repeat protein